jgi:hypothetical protein
MMNMDHTQAQNALNRQRYSAYARQGYLFKEAAIELKSVYLCLHLQELHGLYRPLPMTNMNHMQAQNALNRLLYSAYTSERYLFKEAAIEL